MCMATSKKQYVEELKTKLSTDYNWAIRGLSVLYSFQTEDEKMDGATEVNNGFGFNSLDAEFLTSLYESYEKYGRLSEKQTMYLFKKMPKYANQLFRYCLANGTVAKVDGYYRTVKKGESR